MRLHRLTLTGVGPFKERQEIDFDQLASSGLFLIEGPTGSGKTTIIDAIVYALFGVVSAGGDDLTRMRIRSHYCADADPTGVVCEFSVDGRRHRVTRVPAGARDPEDPDTKARSKGVRQTLTEFGPDGTVRTVLTARREIDEHVSALLQMTAEQFRQLVVLPQGQFAELLRKTPAERMVSLAPLLEDTFIAAVQDDLEQQGRHAREQRQLATTAVDSAANRLVGRLEAWLPDAALPVDLTDTSATDDMREVAITAIREALIEQADQAEQRRVDHARMAAEARRAADDALQAQRLLAAVAEAEAEAAAAVADLHPEDADADESTGAARVAALNQRAGSMTAHADWEARTDERRAERERLADASVAARREAALLTDERTALPARRRALEADLDAARVAAAGVAAATAEVGRLEGVEAALDERDRCREALAARQTDLDEVSGQVRSATEQALAAEQRWRHLLAAQHAGAAAALAALLEADTPCPVCGSPEHPQPAVPATDGLVDDAQVEAARAEADRLQGLVTSATVLLTDASDARARAATDVAVAEAAAGEHDAASVAAALATARHDATARSQAAEQVPTLEALLGELAASDADLADRIAEQLLAAASWESAASEQAAAEASRAAEITALIGPGHSATEVRAESLDRAARLTRALGAWQRRTEALLRVPAAQRLLSVDEATQAAAAATATLSAADQALEEATARATDLALTRDQAAPLADGFMTALADRRELHAQTATAIGLADLVTAGNSRRLQLRSYALQRRFEAVLAAGSIHLERMSRGKFRFALNEETAKAGQSGLGISLFDSWTGQPQDPKSLSGGETFYASLALALGLADVVRGEAGGSALETLFVDEGFGSLDQDTLYQVLDQLDELRAGRRAVGVVSHVTEMKESIPDRIEVRRQPDSTSIVVPAGHD